jgi:uncharacterized surface protein with fasciclin (FAS1) repeats
MRRLVIVFVAVMVSVTAWLPNAQAGMSGSTILDLAVATDDLSTLETAVLAADPAVATTLSSPGTLTVLAPNNAAFAAVPGLDGIIADQALLTNVLLYHVLPQELFAADIIAAAGEDGIAVPTALPGTTVFVQVIDGNVFANGNQVILPDVDATNGVVHVIDGVLIPPIEPFFTPAQPANTGEVTINAGANVPALGTPGGQIVELGGNPLLLPADADNNGFDTYIITDTQTVNGVIYYGLFIGAPDSIWVRADQVLRSR